MPDILSIHTFGAFSVCRGEEAILESSLHSQKLWTIFKFLITNRHRMVSTDALISLLWPEEQPVDPLKLLYTHIFRLRRLLQNGGVADNYILYRQGGYQWNPEAAFSLDAAEFEQLIRRAGEMHEDEDKLPLLRQAVQLYRGEYLTESAAELWVMPMCNYYKRLYLRAVADLADIYAAAAAQEEIIALCSQATQLEPYEENLHERLIRALLINGEKKRAQQQYNHVADLMQREFGAPPSENLQALNQEMQGLSDERIDLSAIKARLEVQDGKRGAYFCTADMFQQIYLLDKRSEERMNFPVFLGLLTLVQPDGEAADDSKLKPVMRILRHSLARTLRNGDIVSQYSKGQYLVLLSAYRQQDAETALSRVKRYFAEEYQGPVQLSACLSQIGRGQGDKRVKMPAM